MVDQDAQQALIPELDDARRAAAAARRLHEARDRAHGGDVADLAPELPVARLLVDLPLAHLDREFDYLVPRSMHPSVVPGSRVKVRFAGQVVDAFVLDRVAVSEHPGRLAPLRRAVSAEPVLSREVADLAGLVAERCAGVRADVLRLAVPPRHARVEKEEPAPPAPPLEATVTVAAEAWWRRYRGGVEAVRAWGAGTPHRAVWSALPGESWADGLAHAAASALAAERGSVLCVPDRRDLALLDAALRRVLGEGRHVLLHADAGPAERYRAFLAVARGAVRVAAGTRAAAFAPVHDLGLVALWDDGDDLHAEPRAPYPHAREVLLLRAHARGAAALVAGTARSAEAANLVESGWAREILAERAGVRARAPRVEITGATDRDRERDPHASTARVPQAALRTIRHALEQGPVLVQTPRAGYAEALACSRCRAPARCGSCGGPLRLAGPDGPPVCRWCAASRPWACPTCGTATLRAAVLGVRRTVEELGRSFPGVPVVRSSGDHVVEQVPDAPALVVATPGAEPCAAGGYAAAVLLDTWLALARPDLRTEEEAARRWFNAAAGVRPAPAGGVVVAVGDPAQPTLQALVRWDPGGLARRELAARSEAHLPPASRLVSLSGRDEDLDAVLAALELPSVVEVLGPVPLPRDERAPAADDPGSRVLLRVPRPVGGAVTRALRQVQSVRSAAKQRPVRVQVDPPVLG